MADLQDLDALALAATTASAGAQQVFENIAGISGTNGLGLTWFGGLAGNVQQLGAYAASQQLMSGERLWRWGVSQGVITIDVPESGNFDDLSEARRVAFKVFVTTFEAAHEQLDRERLNRAPAEAGQ